MSLRRAANATATRQPMPSIPPPRNTNRGVSPEVKAKLLRGLTYNQIAKRCGISITMVCYIFSGQRRISAVTAVKMADALKIPTDQLISLLNGAGKNKRAKAAR